MTVDTATAVDVLPPGLDLTPAKRRLYETAIELFGRDTYDAVSIRDIATALGQQPSTLYFHVSSKQDLLFDIAAIGHRTHFESLRDALMDAGADPADQLLAVIRAHVRHHLDYPALARVTNRELRALTPEHLTAILAMRNQSEQIIRDVVERGARMGAFTDTSPFLDAKAIGAMAVRLPEWWTPDSEHSREEIVERYARYAVKLVS